MIPEDLPDNMQEALKHLGHGSSTIETNVHVALEASVDLAGFSERVEILMDSLAQEAICTKAVFCGIHERVVLDAAKFLEWINGTKRLHVDFILTFQRNVSQIALFLQSVVHRLSGSAPRLFTQKSSLRLGKYKKFSKQDISASRSIATPQKYCQSSRC